MTTGVFNNFVRFFNTPIVKETVKNSFGYITFTLGAIELYNDSKDCYIYLRGRIRNEIPSRPWQCTASKILFLVAKVSIYTSALTTKPAVLAIGWMANRIFTAEQLSRYFGANLNFATNPYHPRHVVSIVSFILGIPATLKSTYDLAVWLRKKISCSSKPEDTANVPTNPESPQEARVYKFVWWNTMTSRPMVHWTNALCRLILRKT